MKKISTKDMVITALLIAFGIIIPIAFGFLRITLPPAFTATLTAHVPIFISMFVSPTSALLTAIGTTIGFFVCGTPVIVAVRAASHIVFALVGAFMLRRKRSIVLCGIVTMLLHAVFEALIAYEYLAFVRTEGGNIAALVSAYTTGVGTLIHHALDYVIAVIIIKALSKAGIVKNVPKLV